uniref:Uncharacterized protein n=1 Tax=Megaselia scalaris TaxID=36166 RepID=T1GMP1_MEGSC
MRSISRSVSWRKEDELSSRKRRSGKSPIILRLMN